jgi:hypothetical protein
MEDRFELIDAFVDGERVDASALKRLLAEDAGRDYFVDAWLLREGVLDGLAAEPVPPMRSRPSRGWPMVAIAASLACLTLGGLAGYRMGAGRAGGDAPPTVASAPASAPSGSSAGVQTGASFPAPTPTRAITVEFSPGAGARGGN